MPRVEPVTSATLPLKSKIDAMAQISLCEI
jgi:hypothetical protein